MLLSAPIMRSLPLSPLFAVQGSTCVSPGKACLNWASVVPRTGQCRPVQAQASHAKRDQESSVKRMRLVPWNPLVQNAVYELPLLHAQIENERRQRPVILKAALEAPRSLGLAANLTNENCRGSILRAVMMLRHGAVSLREAIARTRWRSSASHC